LRDALLGKAADVDETTVALVAPPDTAALDVVVNFGVVTGRRATRAEVERLADTLLERVPHATVSAVERFEIARDGVVGCVEQVRIALSPDAVESSGYEFEVLSELVVAAARAWALSCREIPPEGDLSLSERLAPRTVSLDPE
jgi:hypothetical protein